MSRGGQANSGTVIEHTWMLVLGLNIYSKRFSEQHERIHSDSAKHSGGVKPMYFASSLLSGVHICKICSKVHTVEQHKQFSLRRSLGYAF